MNSSIAFLPLRTRRWWIGCKGRSLAAILATAALAACNPKVDIPQADVKSTLTQYATSHPQRRLAITCSGSVSGIIELELFEDTPLQRANFLRLAEKGFYSDEARFYRVMPGFMIQGGDPAQPEPAYLVPSEIKHSHVRGALAMARREGNPAMASNPVDFYIVTGSSQDSASLADWGIQPTNPAYGQYLQKGGYPSLDGKYTVFGQVTKGMETVDAISKLQTSENAPLQAVRIKIEVAE